MQKYLWNYNLPRSDFWVGKLVGFDLRVRYFIDYKQKKSDHGAGNELFFV